MDWIYFLDLLGTLTFAISGVLTAIDKKFDLVGTLIIGFVTAIGGGTIRDMLIGRFPVGWLNDRNYFITIVVGYVLAYLFQKNILKLKKSMFIFDTIGIGVFTILGIQTAEKHDLYIEVCLFMGVISACFGGVVRDVLTNEIPLIFRKEVYASACLFGGVIYVVLSLTSLNENIVIICSMLSVMVLRYYSIKHKWSLHLKKT